MKILGKKDLKDVKLLGLSMSDYKYSSSHNWGVHFHFEMGNVSEQSYSLEILWNANWPNIDFLFRFVWLLIIFDILRLLCNCFIFFVNFSVKLF